MVEPMAVVLTTSPDGKPEEVVIQNCEIRLTPNGPLVPIRQLIATPPKKLIKVSGFNTTMKCSPEQKYKLGVLMLTRFYMTPDEYNEHWDLFEELPSGEADLLIDAWKREPWKRYAPPWAYEELDKHAGTNLAEMWFR